MQLYIPKVISILGLTIHSYGIFLGLGILIVFNEIQKTLPKLKITDFIYSTVIIMLSAFLGGHLRYLNNLYFNIRMGIHGLSIFGGLIGLFISLAIYSYKYKKSYIRILDKISYTLPLAQAIGRLGNWANLELFGKPSTLPWAIYIPFSQRPSQYIGFETFHPVFWYEAILDFILFLILFIKKKYSNSTENSFALYLIGYGIIRLWTNRFRIDLIHCCLINASDWASIVFIIAGICLIYHETVNKTS